MLPINMNKRRKPRAPLRVAAQVTAGDAQYKGEVLQIGEGGLFLQLPAEPPVGAKLAVGFELPGGFGGHRVVCEVRWAVKPGQLRIDPTAHGVGCRFDSVSPQSQAQFIQFIKKTKQTYSQIQLGLAMMKPHASLMPLLREVHLEQLEPKALKDHLSRVIGDLNVGAS